MRMSLLRLLGVLGLVLATPGCSRCEFTSRCTQEGRFETCTFGSDDEFHMGQGTCAAPNAACLQSTKENITCVYSPATRCDATFVDRCEGSLRVYCNEGFGWVRAVDCTRLGSGGCHIDAPSGKAVCD